MNQYWDLGKTRLFEDLCFIIKLDAGHNQQENDKHKLMVCCISFKDHGSLTSSIYTREAEAHTHTHTQTERVHSS